MGQAMGISGALVSCSWQLVLNEKLWLLSVWCVNSEKCKASVLAVLFILFSLHTSLVEDHFCREWSVSYSFCFHGRSPACGDAGEAVVSATFSRGSYIW